MASAKTSTECLERQWKDSGKVKGKDKSKSKDYGNYGKGADNRGKGKGLPSDVCKLCGGRGHWSRECPVRNLRQVSQDAASTVATQSLVSSGSGAQQHGSGAQGVQGPGTTAVRRVTYFDLDETATVDEPAIGTFVRKFNMVVRSTSRTLPTLLWSPMARWMEVQGPMQKSEESSCPRKSTSSLTAVQICRCFL